FWIECIADWVNRRWYRSEEVLCKHLHHLRIHRLSDNLSIVRYVLEQFVESKALYLLWFHVRRGIIKIEDNITLVELLHKKFLTSVCRDLWSFQILAWSQLRVEEISLP